MGVGGGVLGGRGVVGSGGSLVGGLVLGVDGGAVVLDVSDVAVVVVGGVGDGLDTAVGKVDLKIDRRCDMKSKRQT